VFPTNVLKSGVIFDAGKKNLRVPKYWQPVFFCFPNPRSDLNGALFAKRSEAKKREWKAEKSP